MQKPDYTKLDALIVQAVTDGHGTFAEIYALGSVFNAVTELAEAQGTLPDSQWRIMDRRLQALKAQKRIRFAGRRWRLVAQGGTQ